MNKNSTRILQKVVLGLFSWLIITVAQAGTPLWTFNPLTPTTVSVPANGTALVQYRVTNQSSRPHTLVLRPIAGIVQIFSGLGVCSNPFVLRGKESCVLSLQINGNQLTNPIMDGPIVCQQGSNLQCYRPSLPNILRITQSSPINTAVISVTGSPLTLTVNGTPGQLTVTNTSTQVTATNITANFAGTTLEGNVTETGNTCALVLPGASCTLTFTPGGTVVPLTSFSIQGTNTNIITAAIQITSSVTLNAINPTSGVAAGGTPVTLTGTGFTGATAVTFNGVPATGVNVVSSTTITAVTPANPIGVVDVSVITPEGSATLVNGYTYVATTVGLPASGGVIACLNGGLANLIAATTDNTLSPIRWGITTLNVPGADSDTNGAQNTNDIVTAYTIQGLPITSYAAGICSVYEIDSQGITPCQIGNVCYDDWFLPAGLNITSSGQLNCLNTNQVAIGGFLNSTYWASNESPGQPIINAFAQQFTGTPGGATITDLKSITHRVRCVRNFTP